MIVRILDSEIWIRREKTDPYKNRGSDVQLDTRIKLTRLPERIVTIDLLKHLALALAIDEQYFLEEWSRQTGGQFDQR